MNGQHGELEMTPAIAAVSSPCPAGHAKRPLRPFRLLWVVRDPTTAKTVLARDPSSCAAATSQHRPDSGAGQQLFRGWPGMDSMWTPRWRWVGPPHGLWAVVCTSGGDEL